MFSRLIAKMSAPRFGRDVAGAVETDPAVEREIQRKRLGQIGEEAAVRHLQGLGYRLLERNFLCKGGEVDIIAEHEGMIVFVEVKTRSPRAWASPESAVTPEKRARIIRAARVYLADFRESSPARYDIVGIITDEKNRVVEINVERQAFEPA